MPTTRAEPLRKALESIVKTLTKRGGYGYVTALRTAEAALRADALPEPLEAAGLVRQAATDLAEWARGLCDAERAAGRHDRDCPVDRMDAVLQEGTP